MPPAPMVGTPPAASTTAGSKDINGALPTRCPPASRPWATIKSTPISEARAASSGPETVQNTTAPASFARRISLPQGHNSATGLECRIQPAHLIIDEGQVHAEAAAAAGSGDIAGKHLPHLGFRHVHESDEAHRALVRQSGEKLRRGTAAERGGNYGI